MSSFAIAQFVISTVNSAMNNGSSKTDKESGADDIIDLDSTFLVSVNDDCSESGIRNLALQFSFTKNVFTEDINDSSIKIFYTDSEIEETVFVPGSFENNGRGSNKATRFTFIPCLL